MYFNKQRFFSTLFGILIGGIAGIVRGIVISTKSLENHLLSAASCYQRACIYVFDRDKVFKKAVIVK